jgi:hypothetical protein
MTREVLGERRFEAADIAAFADASGDWNPVHVDPVVARRLLTGGVVAHGASTLLWMLERHVATGGAVPASVDASFPRPLGPGDAATVDRTPAEDGATRLALRVDGEELSSALIGAHAGVRIDGEPPEGALPRREPEVHAFAALAGARGVLRACGGAARDRQAYPALHARLGPRPIAGLMAVSRLVGMHCPGLHSLIASMRVDFDPEASGDELEWRVARLGVAAAPVRVAFRGSGIAGHVDAFVRPAPVAQATTAELRGSVAPGEFAGQTALVVGGSRGLGELVAKLVALGGGDVVITFHAGRDDAQRVAADIAAGGGRAEVSAFDAAHARRDYERIVAAHGHRSHIYYFAAPRIGRAKSKLFSAAAMRDFAGVFVDAFGQLAAAAAATAAGEPIHIFYPSTVFLDEPPRDQAEYVAAKAAGEALCAHFARNAPQLAVLSRRLPRLHTDQSAGLLGRRAADPAPILLALLREIDRPQPTGATA